MRIKLIQKIVKTREHIFIDDNIFLYGFNNISQEACHKMRNKEVKIEAIIDQKAYGSDSYVQIIYVEDLKTRCLQDSVCIVCLNYGLVHVMVAQKMYIRGFRRILYLSMGV